MTAAHAPPPKVKRPAASGIATGPLEGKEIHLNSAAAVTDCASDDAECQGVAERSNRVSDLQAQYALIGWALLIVDGGGFEAVRYGLNCGLATIEEAEQFFALVAPNALADAAADLLDALRGDCLGETEERACSAR